MRLTIALMLSIFCAFSSARRAEGGDPGGEFSLIGFVTCESSTDKDGRLYTTVSAVLEYLPAEYQHASLAKRSDKTGGGVVLLNGYHRSNAIRVSESKLIVKYDRGEGTDLLTETFHPFLVEYLDVPEDGPPSREIKFVGCESLESRFSVLGGERIRALSWQVSVSSPYTAPWCEKPVQCVIDFDPGTSSCQVKCFNANDGTRREYGMRKEKLHGRDVTLNKDGSERETFYLWEGQVVTKAEYEKRLAEEKAKKAG